jgi:glycosyltransferase involved in cell wall biosynthesis
MKILHVLRAPVGGLFRHVVDLATGQIERGHEVGFVADGRTAPYISERVLADLEPRLALGLCRFPISRQPGPTDPMSVWRVARQIHKTGAEIVHGHGAKGGAFARLAPAAHRIIRVYTPHGGSLHSAVGGRIGILMERMLRRRGQLHLFDSKFSRDVYLRKVGQPAGLVRVIHNGIRKDEFKAIELFANASDIVYLGEMRKLKGVDVLIEALAKLHRNGRPLTATLVGDGPDAALFQSQILKLGIQDLVTFRKPLPTREALSLGRTVVVPSRAESLPYVVLEAAAAGKPLIASNVGGIPEIFGPLSDRLVPPDDVDALANALAEMTEAGEQSARNSTALQSRLKTLFSVESMVESVLEAYDQALSMPEQRPMGNFILGRRPRNGGNHLTAR